MTNIASRLGFALLVAAASSSCFRAPIPMTSTRDDASPPATARCLIVLLPGVGDDADDFRKKGVIDTIRRAGLSADVIAADATLGYYLKGMMPERLFVDVVTPAQQRRSYEQTWLVGVSMGGLGALLSAQQHGDRLSGVIALAPYLGRDKVLDAIRDAGGLDAWVPPPKAPPTEDNYDAQLWRFLKAALSGEEAAPPIYLGWGKEDRLGKAEALLAAKLPKDHVFSTEGGHDWGPWNALLSRILHETPIARSCAPTRSVSLTGRARVRDAGGSPIQAHGGPES